MDEFEQCLLKSEREIQFRYIGNRTKWDSAPNRDCAHNKGNLKKNRVTFYILHSEGEHMKRS